MGTTASRVRLLLHKLHRYLEDYGPSVTVRTVLAHLLRPVYFHQIFRIYRINLETVGPRKDLDGQGFTFRTLTTQDGDAIDQVEAISEWLRGEVRSRIAAGQLCVAVFDGETVLGFNLVSFSRIFLPVINLDKRLRHGSAWSEYIAVRKQYRRMGLASQLRYRVFDEVKKRGIRRFYAGTLIFNQPSSRLQTYVGLRTIGDIHYRKILLFHNWKCTRVRE